ncbi:glutathione S-transferase 1 [Dermatophagoides farinae]
MFIYSFIFGWNKLHPLLATKKMSKPVLYYTAACPPCRTVIAIFRMLNIDLEMKSINLSEKEHLLPEFGQINPFHKVPTFVDVDGFVLDESRAICMYLIQSQHPDSSLYPHDDLKKRSQIDRWIQFDISFYSMIAVPFYSTIFGLPIDQFKLNQAKETLKILNDVMAGFYGRFIIGSEQITLADVALYFTCTMMEVASDYYDFADYPHLKTWYERVCHSLKPYDTDGFFVKAIEALKHYVQQCKATNNDSNNN